MRHEGERGGEVLQRLRHGVATRGLKIDASTATALAARREDDDPLASARRALAAAGTAADAAGTVIDLTIDAGEAAIDAGSTLASGVLDLLGDDD